MQQHFPIIDHLLLVAPWLIKYAAYYGDVDTQNGCFENSLAIVTSAAQGLYSKHASYNKPIIQ